MSVEDARAAVEEGDSCWGVDPNKIDRLILEVQAEMPCYTITGRCDFCDSSVPCTDSRNNVWRFSEAAPFCPSCTARMKLKETADAR